VCHLEKAGALIVLSMRDDVPFDQEAEIAEVSHTLSFHSPSGTPRDSLWPVGLMGFSAISN